MTTMPAEQAAARGMIFAADREMGSEATKRSAAECRVVPGTVATRVRLRARIEPVCAVPKTYPTRAAASFERS